MNSLFSTYFDQQVWLISWLVTETLKFNLNLYESETFIYSEKILQVTFSDLLNG